MRALLPQLLDWIDRREPFALATVVATSGSTPRGPGSCLILSADGGRMLGSVSSGCLEFEVAAAAREALQAGHPRRLRFGPEGQPPWSDGLSCGGRIEVVVEPWWGFNDSAAVRAIAPLVRDWLASDAPGAVLSRGPHHFAFDAAGRSAGDPAAFPPEFLAAARDRLAGERPPAELTSAAGPAFVRTLLRRPRLLLVGAVDVAARLVDLAAATGHATVVVDPRQPFAAPERFARQPDRLVRAWPQETIATLDLGPRDAAVVLSHDPKIDDAALLALLDTRAGTIASMGSRRSHAARLARLREAGADPDALARIHGPAGIHLGTPDAAGIALGILAGIVQAQALRTGDPVPPPAAPAPAP